MSRGSGIIQRTNKVELPVAATVTGANNGLSLSGTTVQLGGLLIQQTDIDVDAGFLFRVINAAGDILLGIDDANGIYSLGQTGVGGGSILQIDQPNLTASIELGGDAFLFLDVPNANFQIGDINTVGNGTFLTIDDTAQTLSAQSSGDLFLFLDNLGKSFQMGDIAGAGQGSILTIIDATEQLLFQTVAGGVLDFNLTAGLFQFGDLGNTGNSSTLLITDANRRLTFTSNAGGDRFLDLDGTSSRYQIGDIDGSFNGSFIDIADPNSQIGLFASLGVGINMYPTLSPFAVNGLQDFASNAAALAGGLSVGDFYRFSVAGTSAVMVVE